MSSPKEFSKLRIIFMDYDDAVEMVDTVGQVKSLRASAERQIKNLFLEIVNSSRNEYEIRKKVEEL